MSIEPQIDFGTSKVPTPHFGKVRRPASAWKTQQVAVGATEQPSVSIGSSDQIAFSQDLQYSHTAVASSQSSTPMISSVDVVQRVDPAEARSAPAPHFGARRSKTNSKKAATGYETQVVPLADRSMMPPQSIVPSAESFQQTFASDQVVDRLDFRPNWEVDEFAWPQVTTELLYQHDRLLNDLSTMIDESILRGQKRLAITGVARGEGRTTIGLTLARKLAHQSKRVLVVDADMVFPNLGDSVNLQTEISWLSDRTEFETAAEFLVGNRESQICMMPLKPSKRMSFQKHAYELLDFTLKKVEPFFDIILLDFGPVAQIDASTFRATHLASTALLVHNSSKSDVEQYKLAFEKFQSLAFWRFGLVENGSRSF